MRGLSETRDDTQQQEQQLDEPASPQPNDQQPEASNEAPADAIVFSPGAKLQKYVAPIAKFADIFNESSPRLPKTQLRALTDEGL